MSDEKEIKIIKIEDHNTVVSINDPEHRIEVIEEEIREQADYDTESNENVDALKEKD